jgi:hypothetical protein
MRAWALRGAVIAVAVAMVGCVPDWAQQNSSPYILEIAQITDGAGQTPIFSDISIVDNDDARVTVNAFRKNNNPEMGTSPVEHIYLERYEVRYFRTDGRGVEGVDVPFRTTGPLGNVRFHTPGPGGAGEVQADVIITIVRHQAKLEPPLRNLLSISGTDTGSGQFAGAIVLTCVAEITIHGRTVQGDAMQAVGRTNVTFANFVDN